MDVKDEAFCDLFPDITAAEREAVYDFHRSTPGIHRRVKVERILTEVLDRPTDEVSMGWALNRFRRIVWERVKKCPEVPGVRAFLEARDHFPKYVVSAAPQEELQELARARDFTRYFRDVLGSPPGKAELLGRILRKEGIAPSGIIMYGDRLSDLRAAEDVGVYFVGRRTSFGTEEFPSDIPVIDSFIDLGRRSGHESCIGCGKREA